MNDVINDFADWIGADVYDINFYKRIYQYYEAYKHRISPDEQIILEKFIKNYIRDCKINEIEGDFKNED